MTSVDTYLMRTYHEKTYNCLHFSRDVWYDLTGTDITAKLFKTLRGRVSKVEVAGFNEVVEPVDPCLVVMQRPFTTPHVGVFLRGRVLHLRESGAEFQPIEIASREFKTVRYFV